MAFDKGIHVSKNNVLRPLQEIEQACNQLSTLQRDLEAAIDAFAATQSLLSRAAAYWGQLPLWMQISAGFLLTCSLLIFNVALSLIALCCYTIITFLLNEHQGLFHHNTQKFKTIMQNLTNMLGTLIGLANNVHQQFKHEIECLQEKNQQLLHTIDQLNEQASELTEKINGLTAKQKKLQAIINTHELTLNNLNDVVEEQAKSLQATQKQLTKVTEQSEETQAALHKKIDQLEKIRSQLESEHTQITRMVSTLKNTVISLSNPALANEEHQELLKQKLQDFITSKEHDLSQFVMSTSKINLELEATQKQLQESLHEQAQLRRHLESLINEFAELTSANDEQITTKASNEQKSLDTLRKFSLLRPQVAASSAPPPEPSENNLNC
jgi:chromosome segregation ATPase